MCELSWPRVRDTGAGHCIVAKIRAPLNPSRPSKLTPRLLSQLRLVTARDRDLDLRHFPDFFVVGPQRTGSTWLFRCMQDHPAIGLSKSKEIFYFSTLTQPDHACFRSTDLDDYMAEFDLSPGQFAARDQACRNSHGDTFDPVVWGEATASYAVEVDETVMSEILLLNPDIKAILTIRNPVERLWSHAKLALCRNTGRTVDQVADQEFYEFFRNPYQVACGKYSRLVEFWSSSLKEGHLFIAQFVDVVQRPEGLLKDIYSFLGVSDDDRYIPSLARERVNATTSEAVPDRFRECIEDTLKDDLAMQKQRYGWDWTAASDGKR